MKAWMAVILLVGAAALAALPPAAAHQCSGNCGPCTPNEFHQHADYSGEACQSAPGAQQEAGPDGASQSVPSAGALLAVLGLGAATLVARRR